VPIGYTSAKLKGALPEQLFRNPRQVFPSARRSERSLNELDQPLSVLVADDSAVARKLVAQTLPACQYTIRPARCGKEALELFIKHRPAMVITDWVMPDLTGIELCERIRTECKHSYAYVILLTTLTGKPQMLKALAAGADDFLNKPFVPEELLARVNVGRRIMLLHREIELKNHLLEQLALTDALTGLPNRRAIEVWATRQLSGAMRHGFPFSVIVADLDNFKSVNDRFGHDAGDEVLQRFAEILRGSVRESDIGGRVGGEEFLMVITHVESEGVRLAVERIRKRMEAQRFEFGGPELRVTASFGVVSLGRGQREEFGSLVALADAALYSAKRQGRNRVELATVELH
jgi:two-component system, cell cycle response regulator